MKACACKQNQSRIWMKNYRKNATISKFTISKRPNVSRFTYIEHEKKNLCKTFHLKRTQKRPLKTQKNYVVDRVSARAGTLSAQAGRGRMGGKGVILGSSPVNGLLFSSYCY